MLLLFACLAIFAPNFAAAQGVVNAICSTDQSWCDMAAVEFQKATGHKVLQSHKATGEAFAQLRAEANNPKTDIWWGGTGEPFLQAAELGLLEAYRPDYMANLHNWSARQYAMSKNMVGGFYTSAIGFGWNTESLKKNKLSEPLCWSDMIKPEYKGMIEISHPVSSGTAYTILASLVQIMGEEAAFDYMKRLHKNITNYTRSGQAQAPNVANGEVPIGISFIFGFQGWVNKNFPVKTVAPCEGTGYEVGGIALVKGQRNPAVAKQYYDWLMSPAGQSIGAKANSLQVPANRTFKLDPKIPLLDKVKLIDYDFQKYGKVAERKRLLDRWTKEVESLPR